MWSYFERFPKKKTNMASNYDWIETLSVWRRDHMLHFEDKKTYIKILVKCEIEITIQYVKYLNKKRKKDEMISLSRKEKHGQSWEKDPLYS